MVRQIKTIEDLIDAVLEVEGLSARDGQAQGASAEPSYTPPVGTLFYCPVAPGEIFRSLGVDDYYVAARPLLTPDGGQGLIDKWAPMAKVGDGVARALGLSPFESQPA